MRLLCALLLSFGLLRAETLDDIRREADLVRRHDRALDYASAQARTLRELIQGGGTRAELAARLTEVEEAAQLSLQALRDTGRKASKLSRQFKRGELATRGILRLLEDSILALGVDDRPAAEKARDAVNATHEDYLLGVMTGK